MSSGYVDRITEMRIADAFAASMFPMPPPPSKKKMEKIEDVVNSIGVVLGDIDTIMKNAMNVGGRYQPPPGGYSNIPKNYSEGDNEGITITEIIDE